MCAANNKAMENVANKVFEYNSEETMRDICRAREESLAYQKYVDSRTKKMEEALIEKEETVLKLDEEIAKMNEEIAEKNEEIAEKNEQLAAKEAELKEALELIKKLQAKVQA